MDHVHWRALVYAFLLRLLAFGLKPLGETLPKRFCPRAGKRSREAPNLLPLPESPNHLSSTHPTFGMTHAAGDWQSAIPGFLLVHTFRQKVGNRGHPERGDLFREDYFV